MIDCFEKLRHFFGIKSILVEGGAHIIQNVLENQLVDQVQPLKTIFFVTIYVYVKY